MLLLLFRLSDSVFLEKRYLEKSGLKYYESFWNIAILRLFDALEVIKVSLNLVTVSVIKKFLE